jgi:hypothetical protein
LLSIDVATAARTTCAEVIVYACQSGEVPSWHPLWTWGRSSSAAAIRVGSRPPNMSSSVCLSWTARTAARTRPARLTNSSGRRVHARTLAADAHASAGPEASRRVARTVTGQAFPQLGGTMLTPLRASFGRVRHPTVAGFCRIRRRGRRSVLSHAPVVSSDTTNVREASDALRCTTKGRTSRAMRFNALLSSAPVGCSG